MYPVAIPLDNVDEEQIVPQRWNPADLGRFMVFFFVRSDFRHFDLLSDVVGISCEYARKRKPCPVRLVCGITVANADCAYDPVPSSAVYSKSRCPAALDGDDIVGDGGGSLVAVFAAGVFTCSCRRC